MLGVLKDIKVDQSFIMGKKFVNKSFVLINI